MGTRAKRIVVSKSSGATHAPKTFGVGYCSTALQLFGNRSLARAHRQRRLLVYRCAPAEMLPKFLAALGHQGGRLIMYLYHRVACCCVAACLRDVLPGTTAVRCDMLPFVYTNAPHRSPTALKRSPSLRRHHPRSPQPARLPHSSSRHLRSAHTAVSHFTTSQTAQSHRPPPLPDVQHGRRPGKSAPITPLHLPPARTAAANRLRTPPTAALVARRHRVCPARPRRCRDTGSGASQRALAPRPSSPACRLTPHSALVARVSTWLAAGGGCIYAHGLAHSLDRTQYMVQ
jgi:hypothetical protein